MEIAIASDHAGYELKEIIKNYLMNKDNINVIDLGTDSSIESVDYPDFGEKLAKEVIDGQILGIAICGTGIGMSIACNKVKGIRAALCHDENDAKMAKEHNNANIICLGSRSTDPVRSQAIIETFLKTDFKKGRHQRRVKKLDKIN